MFTANSGREGFELVQLDLREKENHIFLKDNKQERTYNDLRIGNNIIYEKLMNCLHGEIVIVQITDRFLLACTVLALGQLGVDFLLINPKWTRDELKKICMKMNTRQIISDNDVVGEGQDDFDFLFIETKDMTIFSKEPPQNICLSGNVLMCTTGTTDEPKIVARTWDDIFCEVDAVIERLRYRCSDRIFSLAQWTHSLGFVLHFVSGVRAKARLITLTNITPPSFWLQAITKEQVTIIVGVPTFYAYLVQGQISKKYVRMGVSAGAALPRDVNDRFKEMFFAPLLHFYGCTEIGAITMPYPENVVKHPSVGKSIGDIHIDIVDNENNLMKTGQIGFILLTGERVRHKILKDDKYVVIQKEYKTGDMGYISNEGNLYIIGRNEQRVKVNGLSINLGEIENVLQQHPKIIEAKVSAEENNMRDSLLVAYIRCDENLSELDIRMFCQERLAPYKIPHKFFFKKNFKRDEKGQVII